MSKVISINGPPVRAALDSRGLSIGRIARRRSVVSHHRSLIPTALCRRSFRATSLRGLLHQELHTEPFGESGEINRALLKTVRPSNWSRIQARELKSEYRHWSGARDLNPRPHGPEPCRLHILECPDSSAGTRLNSNCRALVSVRVLQEPPGAGNLCPGCAPAMVH